MSAFTFFAGLRVGLAEHVAPLGVADQRAAFPPHPATMSGEVSPVKAPLASQ